MRSLAPPRVASPLLAAVEGEDVLGNFRHVLERGADRQLHFSEPHATMMGLGTATRAQRGLALAPREDGLDSERAARLASYMYETLTLGNGRVRVSC